MLIPSHPPQRPRTHTSTRNTNNIITPTRIPKRPNGPLPTPSQETMGSLIDLSRFPTLADLEIVRNPSDDFLRIAGNYGVGRYILFATRPGSVNHLTTFSVDGNPKTNHQKKKKRTLQMTPPAATVLARPTRTPGRMVALLPIQVSSSMTILRPSARPLPAFRSRGLMP